MEEQQNLPSIEVFVLVYNDGKVAKRAIESVLNQTYRNLQLTILENGSSDDTRSIIKFYASDSRVRIIHNEANIRSGLATPYMLKSKADWVSILFSDDYYCHDRIEKMMNAVGDNAAVFSNNIYVDENGQQIEPPHYISSVKDISLFSANEHLRKFFIDGNSLHPCAMIVRANVFRTLGGFPIFLHRLGDMYLFAKLLGKFPIRLISERLQYITVWTDKRNESALNVHNPMPTAIELLTFTELYTEEPILSRIEKIFSSHLENTELKTEAERLWYLGNIALRYGGVYKHAFGFICLYKAIQLDEAGISKIVLSSNGVSVGVYIGQLIEKYSLHTTYGGAITLRQFLRQYKPFVFLWMTLYRRPQLFFSNLLRG